MAKDGTKTMMPSIVLDASVLLSQLLNEPEFSDEVADIFSFLHKTTAHIYVPNHFQIEVGNVLLMAARQKRIPANNLAEHLIYVENLPTTPHQSALHRTALLANKHKLTLYDAAYLDVAIDIKADHFFTFDKALRKAAKLEGFKPL